MSGNPRGQTRRAIVVFAMVACALVMALAGCSRGEDADGGKTFVYGTISYGTQMDDVGLNPHSAYSGWSCVRYGVGETLFRFNDAMEAEPWLACGYEYLDDTHVRIDLRDDVRFSSGRAMDGEAVKECLDDLTRTHDRAPADMKISSIAAEDHAITITCAEPCPALINYLADPYAAIIDMRSGVTADGNVCGTGPYVCESVSETEIILHPNEDYWDGEPKVDTIVIRGLTNVDALQSALQSGEIDAAYGLAYASHALFESDAYNISDCATSRVFFGQAYYASPVMQDGAVRTAIAMAIDKDGFVRALLFGHGQPAKGPFPATMRFGDDTVTTETYDPEGARAVLEEAGWHDVDGDGIRERNGQRLTVRWLTYPSRPELPLLAEVAQANLKSVGIDVQIISSANHTEIRKVSGAWDLYVSALITAPTGDAEYFFGATCLTGSPKNFGGYESERVDELFGKLHVTFGADERAILATAKSQEILDDHACVFVSFLNMGIVSKANVEGLVTHACDYYEITIDLDV